MTTTPERPTLERNLEAFFYQRVRAVGGICIKMAPTQSGVPDRLVLLPGGGMYLVELKTSTGPLRPIQRYFHERAEEVGTKVYVLRGQGEIVVWLRKRLEELMPEKLR